MSLARCIAFAVVGVLVAAAGGVLAEERSFTMDDDAWIAAEVQADGGSVSLTMDPPDCPKNRGNSFFGAVLFSPEGSLETAFALRSSSWTASGSGVSQAFGAQADPPGISVEHEERSGACVTWKAAAKGPTDGHYVLAAWAAADIDEITVTASTGDGTDLLGVEAGTGAWGFVEADFDGIARAHAYGPILRPWAAADATATAETDNTFVGTFWGAGEKQARTPDGTRSCSCWFTDLHRPGEYAFTVTGAGVLDGVQATGADLVLP